MEYNSHKEISELVNNFILEMHQQTGAGKVFIRSVKPEIYKMFQTTSPEDISDAKESFLQRAKIHVQTLEKLSSTLQHLQKLSEKETNNPSCNPVMARQLAFTKGIVVNTLLKTYGGFGTRVTVYG